MTYAKLKDGNLIRFIGLVNVWGLLNGQLVQKPTHEQILEAGYLPIEDTPAPESREGFIQSCRWVQTDSAIVKKWTELPDRRPLGMSEVNKMLIAQQINTLAVDDHTALRMKSFYPVWAEGSAYSAGDKVRYDGDLWRCLQAHTAIVTWEPVNAHSLWERINETHDGTMEDPIPYSGNMALEKGKHYVQGNIIYLCHRDTGNPVHHALAELVGLYVGEV